MTTTFNGKFSATSASDTDVPMFGTTPVWDRKRKSGLFGTRKVSAEPRANTKMAEQARHMDLPPVRPATATGATTSRLSAAADASPAHAAVIRPRSVKTGPAAGASTLAIAAVVGAVGVLGVAGWFMLREGNAGQELAADPTVRVVAATPILPAEPATALTSPVVPVIAVAPSRPAASPVAPRVRAAARAAETGVVASAVLPDGPQPYSALNPSATPQLVIPTPPVVAETAPPIQEPIAETRTITPEPATDATTPPV